MKSNELRKGDRVFLHNGWFATIEDNKKGNTRLATVEGFETEMGSIYVWDIKGRVAVEDKAKPGVQYLIDFQSGKMLEEIEMSPAQLKYRDRVHAMGF
jgi:hypothetical protein